MVKVLESRLCVFKQKTAYEVLRSLVGSEMCIRDSTKPGDGPAPWPGFLLAASLLEPPDKFSMIARTLSHVKISLKPQGPPEAKAYLQFRHEFASIRARKGAG